MESSYPTTAMIVFVLISQKSIHQCYRYQVLNSSTLAAISIQTKRIAAINLSVAVRKATFMILNLYSVVPIAGHENHARNYCLNHAKIRVSSLLEVYLHQADGINLESPLITEFITDFFTIIPAISAVNILITATFVQEPFFFQDNLHPRVTKLLVNQLTAITIADSYQCPFFLVVSVAVGLLGSETLNMEGCVLVFNS